MRKGTIETIATVAIVAATPCVAQNAASVAINAGSATDVTGVGSSALTIAPSLTRMSGASSSTLGATATKFANDAWSAGISAGVNARGRAAAITPVLDLAASAATTSYDFSYATADLIPSIEVRARSARVFGGARLAAAGTSSILQAPTTTFAPVPGGSRSTRSAVATTAIAGASFTSVASSGEVASVGYRIESGSVAGASQTEQSVSASIANARLMLAGAAGRRVTSANAATFGSATLGVAMTPVVMLQLSAGNYAANPMLGTASGRFVNAGISMRLGRRAGEMPKPSGVDAPLAGRTRVSIRATDADRVELAGDFNKWKPIAATRAGNGVWYVDLDLPPGEYRYAFRVNGKEWRVPEGVAAVDDEFGGKAAWLRVSRSPK